MVIDKILPIDIILLGPSVSELYILDKQERQATHALFRGLTFAIERLIPNGLHRSFVPEDVHIYAIENRDEVRVRLHNGTLIIVNKVTHDMRYVFLNNCDLMSLLMINHVLDRGASGVALVHYAQHSGLLWSWMWGIFHDTWNAVKNAAKQWVSNDPLKHLCSTFIGLEGIELDRAGFAWNGMEWE